MRHSKSLTVLALAAVMALAGCSKFKFTTDEKADWTVQKFYTEAKAALDGKEWENAVKLYQELEARYPYGPYAEQAQIDVAYAYWKHDEPESAVAAVDRFLRLHPTHPGIDYAYYLKGLILMNEDRGFVDRWLGPGDLTERDPKANGQAFDTFRELTARFPDSRYAEDARARMGRLLHGLAMHDIHVARHYYNRKAYVAVINRCKAVLENFQHTPAAEDALGLMALSYREMGMDQLARDSLRVLKTNFPGSSYFKKFDAQFLAG